MPLIGEPRTNSDIEEVTNKWEELSNYAIGMANFFIISK